MYICMEVCICMDILVFVWMKVLEFFRLLGVAVGNLSRRKFINNTQRTERIIHKSIIQEG